MKRIYLASPYSPTKGFNDQFIKQTRYMQVCRLIAKLQIENPDTVIFSPIAHSHGISIWGDLPGDYEYWRRLDESFIGWADELWVADMLGRDESEGIKREVQYARDKGKHVKWL